MKKATFKGYLFEIFCRYLMEESGYNLIKEDLPKIKYSSSGSSTRNVKVQGRGTMHQVDLPYDYSMLIPMINPIRVIGEVKFYSEALGIGKVRDFFGVVEDIKQNHFFASSVLLPEDGYRKLEQGLFISASGFSKGAQRFAMAHNIKLLSPGTSNIINSLIQLIERITAILYDLIDEGFIDNNLLNGLIDELYSNDSIMISSSTTFDSFINSLESDEVQLYSRLRDLSSELRAYSDFPNRIGSFFFGTTVKGHLLLFVSEDEFPDYLFSESDDANASIMYSYDVESNEVDSSIELRVDVQGNDYKSFYASVPTEILGQIQREHERFNNAINLKKILFKEIVFTKIIDGKNRMLKFVYSSNHDENLK